MGVDVLSRKKKEDFLPQHSKMLSTCADINDNVHVYVPRAWSDLHGGTVCVTGKKLQHIIKFTDSEA